MKNTSQREERGTVLHGSYNKGSTDREEEAELSPLSPGEGLTMRRQHKERKSRQKGQGREPSPLGLQRRHMGGEGKHPG